MDNNVVFAFLLTLFAGLSTGFGSLLALFAKKTNPKFLSFSLGFSAGVMIYVSMVEILEKSKDALVTEYGLKTGSWASVISFFAGIAVIGIIDKLVPEEDNPHEFHHEGEQKCVPCENQSFCDRVCSLHWPLLFTISRKELRLCCGFI